MIGARQRRECMNFMLGLHQAGRIAVRLMRRQLWPHLLYLFDLRKEFAIVEVILFAHRGKYFRVVKSAARN
ncbi:MAG: hypothetical protein AUG51_19670 [Acidobacteria bacterium 13_1_20CM_3_53_8]|nr:MAG: hypothetical protein AUG51_19670 [Acidobacteria bacterium 13_1_20CM_3_53_8]